MFSPMQKRQSAAIRGISRLVLGGIFLAALTSTTFAGRWNYNCELDNKMANYFPIYHQIRIATHGDSRGLSGVNPVFFTGNTCEPNQTYPQAFNLNYSSAGVRCFRAVADAYTLRCPKMEWVVVNLSARMFNGKWDENFKYTSVYNSDGCKYDRDNVSSLWNHDNAALTQHNNAPASYSKWGYNTALPDRAPNDGRAEFETSAYKTWCAEAYNHVNYSYNSGKMNDLSAFIDKMNTNGIEVLMYSPPFQKDTYGYAACDDNGTSTAGYTQITDAIKQLAGQKSNFWFEDYYTTARNQFDNSHFFNHDHLNTKGAEKLTKMLSARMNAISAPSCGPQNAVPEVAITSPSNNASFEDGSTVTIEVTASDADGSVSKVEFYNGSTRLGEDASSPYQYTWQNVSAGSYTITAKATDNLDAIGTSVPVRVSVTAKTDPLLSLNKPASASSSASGFGPERAVDGDASNEGRWNAANANYPEWISVDLGSACTVTTVDIHFYEEGDNRRYTYKIETSTDNSSWALLVDRPENNISGFVREDVTSVVVARYVRLTLTGSSSGWANVNELKVYGRAVSVKKDISLLCLHEPDTVRVGDTVTILWETNNANIFDTKIFISVNNRRTFFYLAADPIPKNGETWAPYQWVVAPTTPLGLEILGKQCYIKVTDYNEEHTDESEGFIYVLDDASGRVAHGGTRRRNHVFTAKTVRTQDSRVSAQIADADPTVTFSPAGRVISRRSPSVLSGIERSGASGIVLERRQLLEVR